MSETTQENTVEKTEQKDAGANNADPELQKKIKEALAVPIPGRDDFWHITMLGGTDSKKKFLGIFKKRGLSLEEINDLRKSAIQSPGNTRAKIKKLKTQFPNNPTLYMLSAICTNGMLLNSSNQKEVLRGLKSSTKEAAMALTSNGISVYNCENFFRIYFTLLDRFKRNQVRVYEKVSQDPRLEATKRSLVSAMRVCDHLTTDKSRVFNVLNHFKKKLKSSFYAANFDFSMIQEATRHIDQGNPKEKMLLGTASEVVAYIYALAVAFAKIPFLTNLVDEILKLLPDANKALLIRKISIRSVRNFSRFRLATVEGDRELMAKIGKIIFKDNLAGVQKLEGQSLYQSYETDPFFNLAYIAELTIGLYQPDDHSKIIDVAIQAVESVIKRDMSKAHIFTDSANSHTHKLQMLKERKEE